MPGRAAHAQWTGGADGWRLKLCGDWRSPASLPAAPAAVRGGAVAVDASDLRGWDARLASALWQQFQGLQALGVRIDLQGLPAGLQHVLGLALPVPPAPTPPASGQAAAAVAPGLPPAEPARNPWLEAIGLHARGTLGRTHGTLDFIGRVLGALALLLRGRTDMRASDLAWQLDQTGPRSLPIVALVSFLVGLILAYMGAAQLQRFGAQIYIADLVTVGVVREVAALLVGIVLAGRVGAAFAAQLGSMRANEEIDALQTLGIDPVQHLVLPRVLALALVGPLLTAMAALVGMAAGWLVAVVIYGVTPAGYVLQSLTALTLPHVLIGLFKGGVYAVLVALAGCHQGLSAGRSAQAVGQATTAAVVQAIVWIVVAASALTVVFQRLGW